MAVLFLYAEFSFSITVSLPYKKRVFVKGIEFKGLFLNGKSNIDKKSYINRFSF